MTDNSRIYENFLEYRRNGNTLSWISRDLNLQVAFKQKKTTSPAYHKEAVLKSPKIQDLLEKISVTQKVPKAELEKQVRLLLDEIGYKKNWKVIRSLGLVLTKICLTVSSGIYVNNYKVEKIKSAMGNCPVIFLPSHRSYVDFILMSYVCFAYEIAIPAVAAGMDFHGMVGMGSMLRNTGAFFMRRSYNDDSLYWTTFKQYIYQLVTEGDLPIEFFIEGTRSRSNKSLTPKFGILAMIMKAFFFAQVPDILFVPINISYDRILEESLFAYELLGVPKPKESTSGFFKSMKILKEHFGNIYYTFDEPISAKEFFGDKLDRSAHTMAPLHLQEITQSEKNLLPPLAYEIVRRQQKSIVLTVFNLMSVVINHYLSTRQHLTIYQLREEVIGLKEILETFGAVIGTDNLQKNIDDAFVVHGNLIRLSEEKRIELLKNTVSQDDINPKILKGHSLTDRTMTESVSFVMLQIYINPVLQYFVDGAVLVIILSSHHRISKGELFYSYHFLRSLYLFEFVDFEPNLDVEFNQALSRLTLLDVIKLEDGYYSLAQNKKLQNILATSIEPFLYSYSTMLAVLKNLPTTCDEKTILANTQMIVERAMFEENLFVHPYCLNLDTLGNCLGCLVSKGILKKNRRENKNMYEIHIARLEDIIDKFGLYVTGPSIDKTSLSISHQQNKL